MSCNCRQTYLLKKQLADMEKEKSTLSEMLFKTGMQRDDMTARAEKAIDALRELNAKADTAVEVSNIRRQRIDVLEVMNNQLNVELAIASKAAAQWQDEASLTTRKLAIAVEALTRLGYGEPFAEDALREIEAVK